MELGMALRHLIPHDWKEWRRMRAWQLNQQGWTQRHIAHALDVSEGAVSQWLTAAQRGGPGLPEARSHPAFPPATRPDSPRLRL